MAQRRLLASMDDYGRAFPLVDEGTLNRQASHPPGPIGAEPGHPSFLRQAVDGLLNAKTWHTVDHYAVYLLGPESFALGIIAGMGEGVVDAVLGLLDLMVTFVLADLYDAAHKGAPLHRPQDWLSNHLPDFMFYDLYDLNAQLVNYLFQDLLESRHKKRDALLKVIDYAVHHIRELFNKLGHEYVEKYDHFK